MKSFHIRRSLFLITGSHHNPHDFRDYYSLVHQLPIKIFLLNSQKRRQMRQSNLPPLLHPPKVGGLLSRNLACKCSCNFTKICFPICFVFLHKICFPICFCISPQARQAALQPHQYFSWEIAYLFVSIGMVWWYDGGHPVNICGGYWLFPHHCQNCGCYAVNICQYSAVQCKIYFLLQYNAHFNAIQCIL